MEQFSIQKLLENYSTTDEMLSERAGVNLELGENRWTDLNFSFCTFR